MKFWTIWWAVVAAMRLGTGWPFPAWFLVTVGLAMALDVVKHWRAWAQTAHRPHVDPDWHDQVAHYRGMDWDRCQDLRNKREPFTWLEESLWAVAAWAPFGAKMIWRGARPYMARVYLTPWWCPRQLFLHRILMSDDGIHNHPYGWSCSLILTGGYREVRATPHYYDRGATSEFSRVGKVGTFKQWFNWIPAGAFHALELTEGPVWTLFVCGPRDREWGFLDDAGGFHPVGAAQRPDVVTGYGVAGENLPPEIASQQAFTRKRLEIPPPPLTAYGLLTATVIHPDFGELEIEYDPFLEVDLDDTQPMTTIPEEPCGK